MAVHVNAIACKQTEKLGGLAAILKHKVNP